ncbi:MAG TPA: hypothetical protein VGJ28_10025 [Micromonosporaceae bacterium]
MGSTQILLIVAIVVYIIVKRFAGAPVGAKTLVLPLVMAGYGLVQLAGAGHAAINTASVALLVIEALVGIAAGVARGMTIHLYLRDGHLWQRYRVVTLLVWLGMVAVRIGLMAAGGLVGAHLPEAGTIFFSFGLSMVLETLVVGKRAAATGVPIMARQSRRPSVNARY